MNAKIFLVIILFYTSSIVGQEVLTGIVKEKNASVNQLPLIGANVYWHNSNVGTTTDINGNFTIELTKKSHNLVISYIGYKADTVAITNQRSIEVYLESESNTLEDVEITAVQKSTFFNHLGIENTSVITEKELLKAACCTLAESFETNPSIDVSLTDAITGARQIEMLGLSGIYTQTTMEVLPYLRGLISNAGLFFIPGSWIRSINVSKGIGSVSNGYESITGQIDIDLQEPFDVSSNHPAFLNLYGNDERRVEGNFNYRHTFNDNLSSMTLLHASSRNHKMDINSDSFIDAPTNETINIMQRWQYRSLIDWESQLGFQYVWDKKSGGTLNTDNSLSPVYKFGSSNRMLKVFGKLGYIFHNAGDKSIGLQWSYSNFTNTSQYGNKSYRGNEQNIFLNLIYNTNLWNEENKIRIGTGLIYDEYDEVFNGTTYKREEKVPGAFVEYTYKPNYEFSLTGGLRIDNHNHFGLFLTPRLHVRYSPDPDWVFRAVVGKGYRTSNIFTEYGSSFASSRQINIEAATNYGYGLDHEEAWNYGFNVTYYFVYQYRDATLTLDFYRTDFEKVTIADLYTNPREINFRSVDDGAYSNSFQAELNIEPVPLLNARIAYRFIDAKQFVNGKWIQKPFTSRHRALINFGLSSEKESADDAAMSYDLTLQWFGSKRIPSTSSNPAELRGREKSPDFLLVNAQITRSFNNIFDLYIGVENLFNFRQNNPIIDPGNPNGQFFDASLIWGPVTGRMIYSGLRYKL
ncbi:TonB-dependent receptor domain-containing protein [Bacteroidota bacterium]